MPQKNQISEISKDAPLWLVGCGKMGTAMLRAWLQNGLNPEAVNIIDPCAHQTCPAEILAEQCYDSVTAVDAGISPSIIILAVKPQIMDKVLSALQGKNASQALFISVAAGKTIADIGSRFGHEAAVVRAMPNIPAAVGKGMTGMVKNKYVTPEQQTLVSEMFGACGKAVWLEDEADLNAVTAVSGSGPAYVFHLVEAMTDAGVALGLDEEVASVLARQTIIGAAALLEDSDAPASELRENVTSPKGTTAAALDVLMADDGLAKLMLTAMTKARDRGKELS